MRITTSIVLLSLVAACGDPMADVPRYSDQDIPEDSVVLDAVPASEEAEERGGFLSRLLNGAATESEAAPVAAPRGDAVADPVASGDVAEEAQTLAQETAPATKKRRGLLGLFAGSAAADPSEAAVGDGAASVDTSQAGAVELASIERGPEAEPGRSGRGLLGLFGGGADAAPVAAATSEIAPGTVLPYGQVARICGLPASAMGRKIAGFPERGPKYALHDSDPGNTGPHTFYLTGFDDGCARQFTASLAVFGSVTMHEQLRYGLPAEVQPYSTTDEAYEDLKRDVCNVPRRKPCGQRIRLLERDTVFLSIYERFGGNAQWSNLLLHDGRLVAQDHKGSS